MNRRWFLRSGMLATLVLSPCLSVPALQPGNGVQAEASPMPVDEVVHRLIAKNAERAAGLQTYSGTRVYHLVYKGFPGNHEAEMTVQMEFNAPYSKQFTVISEGGSTFLIKHVLKRLIESEQEASNPENQQKVAVNTDNYTFSLASYQPSPEGGMYVLNLAPKSDNKFLYRGQIWVDGHDFAVTRIEAEPAKNPSFWITKTQIQHRYGNISGFWLPLENRTTSKLRSGQALLTIEYQEYKVDRTR